MISKIVNEIIIRKEIIKVLDKQFNLLAVDIAAVSDVTKSFKDVSFSSKSLNDELVKNDQFGLVYIGDVDYEVSKDKERSALVTIPYTIQVIFLDKGNLTDQISLIRMTLVDIILKEDWAWMRFAEIQITSTTPVDIKASENGILYMSAGILLTVKIGV